MGRKRTNGSPARGGSGRERESERSIVVKKRVMSGERRGLSFQGNVTSGKRAEIGVSLPSQIKLWELQETLHAKAKGNPSYRFYALYDKVYRADVLAEAWRRSRANGGASGVDGVEFEQIEREGVEQWLGQLGQELKAKRYRTRSSTPGNDSQSQRQAETVGNTNHPRQSGADGSGV